MTEGKCNSVDVAQLSQDVAMRVIDTIIGYGDSMDDVGPATVHSIVQDRLGRRVIMIDPNDTEYYTTQLQVLQEVLATISSDLSVTGIPA